MSLNERWAALTVGIVAVVAATGGALLLWTGLHYVRDELVPAGATIVAASLVALTAAAGVDTWSKERTLAREERARAAYEAVSTELIERFNKTPLAQVRAQVASWADDEIVRAMGSWNEAYDRHVPADATGDHSLSAEGSEEMQGATVDVLAAIRETHHLSGDRDMLRRAIFNRPSRKSDRPADKASAVEIGDVATTAPQGGTTPFRLNEEETPIAYRTAQFFNTSNHRLVAAGGELSGYIATTQDNLREMIRAIAGIELAVSTMAQGQQLSGTEMPAALDGPGIQDR